MKKRKLFSKEFIEGVKSATDISGSKLTINRRRSNIEASWYNVGVFFNRGFNSATKKDDDRFDKYLETM